MKILTYLIFCLSLSQNSFFQENNPGARWGHVLVYHPEQKKLLLFGGAPERGEYTDDTWIWDGEKWQEMNIDGPPARGFCAAAYHEERKSVIIHGGRGDGNITYGDTWEWDGNSWKKLNDNELFKADHHEMVYHPLEKKLIAFGGWGGRNVLGDTWEWSVEWKKLEISSPPPRSAFGMTYNIAENKIQLFGGLWINGQYADVWEYAGNEWKSVGGPYDNSSLDHHAMIYDEKLGQVVIFGGKNYRYKMQNSTLTIAGQNVTTIMEEGPSARHSIGFTYDPSTMTGYVYGGKEYQGELQVSLADFWMWKDGKWEKID